ncbi:MAG: hypothetical protein VXZ40_04220 [Nanoarchaeota archaeon]|nr:hypothetical protein [Nanoarchaeota archaeon]
MLRNIVDFIEDEYKGIIAGIVFLMIILIVSLIMSLISGEVCKMENNMELDLKENSACEKIKTFDSIIDVLVYTFFFIGSIASIYGLYKLIEELIDYFR